MANGRTYVGTFKDDLYDDPVLEDLAIITAAIVLPLAAQGAIIWANRKRRFSRAWFLATSLIAAALLPLSVFGLYQAVSELDFYVTIAIFIALVTLLPGAVGFAITSRLNARGLSRWHCLWLLPLYPLSIVGIEMMRARSQD